MSYITRHGAVAITTNMGTEGYKTISSSVSAWVANIVAQWQAITMYNKNEKNIRT